MGNSRSISTTHWCAYTYRLVDVLGRIMKIIERWINGNEYCYKNVNWNDYVEAAKSYGRVITKYKVPNVRPELVKFNIMGRKRFTIWVKKFGCDDVGEVATIFVYRDE